MRFLTFSSFVLYLFRKDIFQMFSFFLLLYGLWFPMILDLYSSVKCSLYFLLHVLYFISNQSKYTIISNIRIYFVVYCKAEISTGVLSVLSLYIECRIKITQHWRKYQRNIFICNLHSKLHLTMAQVNVLKQMYHLLKRKDKIPGAFPYVLLTNVVQF